MQRVCDVCGNQKMRRKHTKVGTIVACQSCGSSFDYYYRKDGRLLDYPALWGKAIAVIYEPSGSYDVRDGGDGDLNSVSAGDTYYVFLATDGTIRRARIADYGAFDDKTPRPEGVPKNIEWFHTWQVDVLPSGRETERSE